MQMDSWSEKSLKFMSIGGNERCTRYFEGFDLQDEPVNDRYKTEAMKFYRQQVSDK
jgi:hypothetical protein